MKKYSGFTLVELLAVIVVLAIIMIIAIPSVLNIMNSAKRKSFENFAYKVSSETQKQYTKDSIIGTNSNNRIYNITKELELGETGNFKGYSLISPKTNEVYITLYDDELALIAINTGNNISNSLISLTKLSDEEKSYKLTPEYLCSMIESGDACIYLVEDEYGNASYETITLENHEYDSVLDVGENIRSAISNLIVTTEVTRFKYSETIPEGVEKIIYSI